MGKFFGTDGFRGEVNETLTGEHAFRLGCFLAQKLSDGKNAPSVVIGKDPRRSSYMLEYSVAAGLTSCGANAYLLHVTTTPSVSYCVRAEGFDMGVMISASHNKYVDNGIKLLSATGEKADKTLTDEAEQFLLSPAIKYAKGDKIGRSIDHSAGRSRYVGYLLSTVKTPFVGMKVGLDTANGSAYQIAPAVFSALGARVYSIGVKPNGLNINKEVGSTAVERLRALVRNNRLNVGFAFDGDADRCIAVDENGSVVDGDGILYLSAQSMLEREELCNNTVVGTVLTGAGLERSLKKKGVSLLRTAVGDSNVCSEMKQKNCSLGGERSGHIVYSKYAVTGDGVLTALRLAEIMAEKKLPLSALLDGYAEMPSTTLAVSVKKKSSAYAENVLSRADALRHAGLNIVVRPSGTEQKIRVFAEGESAVDAKIAAELLKGEILRADVLERGV